MKEAGVTSEGAPQGMWKLILAGALQNFVIIYILAHFMLLAEGFPGADPVLAGVWIAILVAASHLGSVIWEKKSFSYFAINAGYLALVIFMSALIIAKWPWA